MRPVLSPLVPIVVALLGAACGSSSEVPPDYACGDEPCPGDHACVLTNDGATAECVEDEGCGGDPLLAYCPGARSAFCGRSLEPHYGMSSDDDAGGGAVEDVARVAVTIVRCQ